MHPTNFLDIHTLLGILLLFNTASTDGQFVTGGFLDVCTSKVHNRRLSGSQLTLPQMSGFITAPSGLALSSLGTPLAPTAAYGATPHSLPTRLLMLHLVSGTVVASLILLPQTQAAAGISQHRAPIAPCPVRSAARST